MEVKIINITLRPKGQKPEPKHRLEEKVREAAYYCSEDVWLDPSLEAARALQRAMETLADYGEYEMPLTLDNVMNGVVAGIQRDSHRSIMHHRKGFDFIPANCTLSAVEVGLVNIMSRKTVLRQYLNGVKSEHDYHNLVKEVADISTKQRRKSS